MSNDQVLRYVIDGGIMERPENCPNVLYRLMSKCWQHRPTARPSFLQLESMILHNAEEPFKAVSFYHSAEGQDLVLQMQNGKNLFLIFKFFLLSFEIFVFFICTPDSWCIINDFHSPK